MGIVLSQFHNRSKQSRGRHRAILQMTGNNIEEARVPDIFVFRHLREPWEDFWQHIHHFGKINIHSKDAAPAFERWYRKHRAWLREHGRELLI